MPANDQCMLRTGLRDGFLPFEAEKNAREPGTGVLPAPVCNMHNVMFTVFKFFISSNLNPGVVKSDPPAKLPL